MRSTTDQIASPEKHTEPSSIIPSHRAAKGLTEAHLTHMSCFHFYGSLYSFSGSTRLQMTLLSLPDYEKRCQPPHVTITIQYTGWSHWPCGLEPELSLEEEETFQ